MKRSFLAAFWERLGGGSETVTPGSAKRLRLSGKALRIPLLGQPAGGTPAPQGRPGPCSFEVEVGQQRIWLCPDLALDPELRTASPDFLLFDPLRYLPGPGHFLRLTPGTQVVISHSAEDQRQLFSHPREVYRRHFQVRHEGDALVFKDPISELGTYVSVLEDEPGDGPLVGRRRRSLERVMEIFGGALEPLSADAAMAVLDRVNHLLRDAPHRPKDADGNAGGLLELPATLTPVVVGDLHARLDNLLKILSENGLMEGLERGDTALILLGDEVHPESDEEIEEMDSSILMMDLILKLMARFPAQVFLLLGNHDSFSIEVVKHGVPQGLLWRKRLKALRGEQYVEQMELFYQLSPLVVVAESFVACHAGPPRAGISRQALVDARRFPGLVHELTWTRARTPVYPAGYSAADVNRFRKSLGVSRETPFIVGHHPVTEDRTVWLNARRIQNHHVVFSAKLDQLGLMIGIGGEMLPHVYPAEPLLSWVNERATERR